MVPAPGRAPWVLMAPVVIDLGDVAVASRPHCPLRCPPPSRSLEPACSSERSRRPPWAEDARMCRGAPRPPRSARALGVRCLPLGRALGPRPTGVRGQPLAQGVSMAGGPGALEGVREGRGRAMLRVHSRGWPRGQRALLGDGSRSSWEEHVASEAPRQRAWTANPADQRGSETGLGPLPPLLSEPGGLRCYGHSGLGPQVTALMGCGPPGNWLCP